MPRQRVEAPVVPTNALVASATRYPGKVDRTWYPSAQGWQVEAWRHYDICPELRFAANWIGNALSRIVLEPGRVAPDGRVTQDDGNTGVGQLLHVLFGGSDGQPSMLSSLGIHLTIAGEAYIVGRKTSDGDVW